MYLRVPKRGLPITIDEYFYHKSLDNLSVANSGVRHLDGTLLALFIRCEFRWGVVQNSYFQYS